MSTQRRPRIDGDMRDRYPLLAEWVEADRRDGELGERVAEWLRAYRRTRATGPTWYAVAEFVRPDLQLVPDSARRWYASQLVNRLVRVGWLAVADAASGAGHLEVGPRAAAAAPELPFPPDDGADPEPRWTSDPLF
ncbi:hypothetical protein ACIBF1_44145 [Spirillospora sp. NPDC050679]